MKSYTVCLVDCTRICILSLLIITLHVLFPRSFTFFIFMEKNAFLNVLYSNFSCSLHLWCNLVCNNIIQTSNKQSNITHLFSSGIIPCSSTIHERKLPFRHSKFRSWARVKCHRHLPLQYSNHRINIINDTLLLIRNFGYSRLNASKNFPREYRTAEPFPRHYYV